MAGLLLPARGDAQVIAPAIPVASKNTRFIKAVHEALELLRQRSPQDFAFAVRHVGRVEEVELFRDKGMVVWAKPPTARLRRQEVTAVTSTWLAAGLVHEACHRMQFLRGIERHGGPFPPAYEYSGRIAELECLKMQAETLERIGAPAREVEWTRKADGRHYLRNPFGSYDAESLRSDPSLYDPREKLEAER